MTTFDPTSASLFVLTFTKGLLSAAGHDLKLQATRFTAQLLEDGRIVAEVDPSSLEVVAAQQNGEDVPEALSARDMEKIEANLRDEVLEVRRHGGIRFASHVDDRQGSRLPGTLLLHGQERPVTLEIIERPDHVLLTTDLHQPDFGITPYKALLGAIQVREDVRVIVELPRAPLEALVAGAG